MDVFDCRMGCVCEVGVSGDVSLVAEATSIANGHVCVFRHTHHAIIEEVREDVETLGGEEVYSTGQLIFGSWSWVGMEEERREAAVGEERHQSELVKIEFTA